MAYYVKYNDIDLTNMIKVKTVESSLTPPRENSTIDIWEKAGEIYNGHRWETREITINFLLLYTEDEYEDNPLILEQGLRDIRVCFNVDSPKALFLNNPDRFIYAVPDGEIEVSELRYNCAEVTVTFSCYDPFYYSTLAKSIEGTNELIVDNEGDLPTEGIITIGIDEECHFVQVENATNGKKMLIGNYPMVSKPSAVEKSDVIVDECLSTSDWTVGSTSVDANRSTNGTLALTEAGQGLMCGNFGDGNTTWKGVGARRNLGTSIENFQVEADVFNISTGTNGDPTVIVDATDPKVKYQNVPHITNVEVVEGSRTEQYKVICYSLHVRSGPSKSYGVVGYLMNGDVINPSEWAGYQGYWAKIGEGRWCYASPDYVQKTVIDTTTVKTVQKVDNVTVTKFVKNYYTNSTATLREGPTKDSRLICNIPAGEVVRIIEERLYQDNDNYWFALDVAWNGYWGYIEGIKVSPATNVAINYPTEAEPSEDKTGTIELYGYDNQGVQLFKMSMQDENSYFAFNYPCTTVGGRKFLADTNIAPTPLMNTSTTVSGNQLVVNKEYIRSGRAGDWNDFRGTLGIRRENGYWQAWFLKMDGGIVTKEYWSSQQKMSYAPTGKLSYLTLYIGSHDDKPSDMSLQRLVVKNLTPQNPEEVNIKKFQQGDVLKIDMYNNKVWLNDKPYNDIDIGSQFFSLETGENIIKISSDKGVHSNIMFNEKYL